ncbi:unnamed protein product [Lactuca virosa]|uniref:Transposase, Ptta/En/Spm, plant n=1 Tax=Lactuca virosa TaxID=75947 RepID=A0AAU9NQ37_9ASTR|nr:unnamed protein product [Lactuca virosa]
MPQPSSGEDIYDYLAGFETTWGKKIKSKKIGSNKIKLKKIKPKKGVSKKETPKKEKSKKKKEWQHMLELKDLNPRHARNSTWLHSQHSRTFISWFKKEVGKRLANGENICDDVRWLAKGPNFAVNQQDDNLHVVGFPPHRMYKYGSNGETDDMLEFDATFDLTQDSALLDIDDDFLYSASDKDEDSKQRGSTTKEKANKVKLVVTYNKKGVPVGKEATKLSTFKGLVARTMVPITYESWLEVSDEEKFVVDPKSRKQTLQSIGKKWRNLKHYLYAKFIMNRSKDPKANLFKPPKDYLFIKKEDWKVFVSHRVTKKWEEKGTKAKNTRAHHKYNHRLSRKGYARLINDIMQETGKTEEEIDRTLLWKKERELKT